MSIFDHDVFQSRHIGPAGADNTEMLRVVGASSVDALIDSTVYESGRRSREISENF